MYTMFFPIYLPLSLLPFPYIYIYIYGQMEVNPTVSKYEKTRYTKNDFISSS